MGGVSGDVFKGRTGGIDIRWGGCTVHTDWGRPHDPSDIPRYRPQQRTGRTGVRAHSPNIRKAVQSWSEDGRKGGKSKVLTEGGRRERNPTCENGAQKIAASWKSTAQHDKLCSAKVAR